MQYAGIADEAKAAAAKPERPDRGGSWESLGSCDTGGGTPQPFSIYGVWHCGNHYCDWDLMRDTSPGEEFDQANHWIIDRGDGTPSVNLVVLSFLEPLELLNQTTNEAFVNGIPRGITPDAVNYF